MGLICASRGKGGKISLNFRTSVLRGNVDMEFSRAGPVVTCHGFRVGPSGCLFLNGSHGVRTGVSVLTSSNATTGVCSAPGPRTLRSLSVTLRRMGLRRLASIVPCTPRVANFLRTSTRLVRAPRSLSIMTRVTMGSVAFRKTPLKLINLDTMCLPGRSNARFVSAHVSRGRARMTTLSKSCGRRRKRKLVRTSLSLVRFPLSVTGNFVPSGVTTLTKVTGKYVGIDKDVRRPGMGN